MSVWGGRGRKNGIYRNLLESINDTLPRIPLVTVMPRVCRDCRHVRLREWNEMWGDIKCAVLNFFSHADNRRTKSLSATNSWKNPHRSVSLDQNWFNSDFYHKTFQVVWGTKKSFFHFYRRFFLIRLTLGKIRAKASQPSAVDEFFRGRDGSGGWEGSILDLECDFLHYWHI